MNNKALTLSLVMAVVAVFFVQSYVQSIEDEAKKKFGTEVLVVKAKRNIDEQETLNETMLMLDSIPKRFLEPSSIYYENKKADDPEVVRAVKQLFGAVPVVPIRKGEQITYNKLTEPSIRTGLAPQVAPGRRAVAVPVTEISGVAKLVKPGDRVDLIAVIDAGAGKDAKIAKTILQDVVVLSVGRNVSNNAARLVERDPYSGKEKYKALSEDANFASVTLEVEPAQAQTVAMILANGEGSLMLSLRNNDDTDRVNLGAVTIGDILGADAARVQRAPGGRR